MTIPLWQAPLPFELIPANIAGQISAQGALGMIRVATHSNRETLLADIEAYRQQHNQPTFCFYHPLPNQLHDSLNTEASQHLFAQAGIEPSFCDTPDDFATLLDIVLENKPRMIGFAHGLPEEPVITRIHAANVLTFAVCHNVAEAVVAEDQGINIIVLQGNDAGGLHSHFNNQLPSQPQSAMVLLRQARQHLTTPIVIWGDFPEGRDVVAAMICGADAVMLDRPLLSCTEIPLDDAQRQQLNTQNETHSIISDQFSTLPMRLLPNELIERLHSDDSQREIVLHEILRRQPEWRPLCVSPTQCSQYATINDCLNAYHTDIARYLA